ncbi:hypothetical protein A6302_03125 [Methylobrevis pamukkalensis]|uniref:Uncharacterized protein n=2 Tax=Methylobrevis pamukkalensis TaxID=1439726 RepID=A0A1E3GZU1_9HYPH|nr:hypothetical protein A6302_03125 [Methylobrevis pamukkalensis]
MTAAERLTALRDMLGDEAIHRLSGLDRRTIQRIAAGEATLHAETAGKLRDGIEAAARAAGAGGQTPVQVVRQVAAVTPRGGSAYYLVAALLAERGRPMLLRDLCIEVSGDPNASAPNSAAHALEKAGLIRIEPASEHHLAKQAVWIGAT